MVFYIVWFVESLVFFLHLLKLFFNLITFLRLFIKTLMVVQLALAMTEMVMI